MAEEAQIGIRMRAHVGEAVQALNRLEREIRQLDGAATRVERGWNRAAKSIKDFAFAGLLANTATAGLLRVGSAIGRLPGAIAEAGVAAENLEKRFRFAFDGAAEGARQLDFVRGEAQRLGIDFAAAAQSYSGLATATRGTALEGAATREAFTAIAEAAQVMGLSTSEAQGALTALEQIASKGAVSAEELRGQLGESLPGAFQIAARAMGVSTAELERMLAAGELLAADFLPRFAAQIRAEMAGSVPEAVDTAAASFARLRNAMREIGEAIAESRVADFVASSAEGVANLLRTPTVTETILASAREVAAQDAAAAADTGGVNRIGQGAEAGRHSDRAATAAALATLVASDLDALDAATEATAERAAELRRRIAALEKAPPVYERSGYSKQTTDLTAERLADARSELATEEATLDILRRQRGPLEEQYRFRARLRAPQAEEPKAAPPTDPEAEARAAAAATERLEALRRAAIERTMQLRLEGIELLQWQEEQALAAIAAEEHASLTARQAAEAAIRDEFRARREELDRQADERRAARREAEAAEEERRKAERRAREEEDARRAAEAQREHERADPFAGAEAALERLGTAAEDAGDRVGSAIETGFRSAEDALVRFATTGRLEFASLTGSILADLARIAARRAIVQPLAAALGSALGSLDLGGGGGASVPAAAQSGNVYHAVYPAVHHAGGAAGAPGGASRAVPPALFAGAPRLHRGGIAGLRSDEVPAILQRGETVLPRGAPAAAAPTEVRVEVTNSGTPQRVTQADGRFDGSRLVISLVAEDVAGGGPVAGAIGRAFDVRPRTG